MAKIGLQLYSIKEISEKDFFGAIRLAVKYGYNGVEFAGFFNASSEDLKKLLYSEGIEPCGSHTSIDLLKNDFDRTVEYNLEIGNRYIVIPGIPEDMYGSGEAWLRTADTMNNLNARLKMNGLKLGYHNHAYEFEKFNGEYGYDILAQNTSDDILLEIDTFWIAYAGLDVNAYIKKYRNRLELLHLKDINDDKISTEIGNGNMDFAEIIESADNTEWIIVEQEHFSIPQEVSIKTSCDYLKGLIG